MKEKMYGLEKMMRHEINGRNLLAVCLFFVMILLFSPSLMRAQSQDCPAAAVPMLCNFDSDSATAADVRGILPDCWEPVFMGSDSTYAPHVSPDFAPDSNALLLTAGDSSIYGTSNCVILPAFAADYSALGITFTTKMENDTIGQLTFGYWHTEGMVSYFTPIQVVPSSTSAVEHFVSLRELSLTSDDRLALSWSNNDTCAHCSIDLVEVDSLVLCQVPSITNCYPLSDSQIRVEWQQAWRETSWMVEYMPQGVAHGEGVTLNVTEPTCTLSELLPGITYQVYVRAVCSIDSLSDWSVAALAVTPCESASIPYWEDMESYTGTGVAVEGPMPTCWSSLSAATPARSPHVSTYNAFSGDNGLVMTARNASGFSADNYVAVPWFASDLDGVKVSFSSRMDNVSGSQLTFGYMTNVLDAASFVTLESVTSTTTATPHEYSLAGTNIPDGARLAFRWYSASTSWDWRCVIDNFSVEFLPCPTVTDIQVSDVMMTTATASWKAGSIENEWRVVYGPAGFDPASEGISINHNDTILYLTELIGQQPYDLYVQAICDPANPSPLAGPVTFTPYCLVVADTTVMTVCDSVEWNGKTYAQTGVYVDTLYRAAEFQCDSVVILNLTVHYSVEQFETLELCQNELPAVWRDTTFEVGSVDGDYQFHRLTVDGCDSIVNLSVTIYPAFYLEENETICQQDLPYTWRDTVFEAGSQSGDFLFTRHTIHGCDSLVTLHLVVNESKYEVEYAQICQQELPYTWRDTTFETGTQSGVYVLPRTTSLGCDSIVTFVLVVHPAYDEHEVLSLCRSELPYTWRDTTFSTDAQSGTMVFNKTTIQGCDSIVTLTLDIREATSSEETVEICASELPYVWRDQVFTVGTESGVYTYSRTNAAGCDSTATLTLIVHPTYSRELSATICSDDLPYTFGDTTFQEGSETQTVVRHLTSAHGCDSVVTLNLTVNHPTERYETIDLCRNRLPFTYYDTVFHVGTPTDTYVIRRQTSQGCDSIVYLTLNIRQSFGGSETIEVCESDMPFIWNDEVIDRTYTTGTYSFAGQTQYGCDSIWVLRLVVHPLFRQYEAETICESDLPYTWRDTVFQPGTRGGTYLFERPSAAGCDSVVILTLTVNPSYQQEESLTLCESELPYTWRDVTLPEGTQSGDIQYDRTTVDGCDSTVMLHLTVNPVSASDEYVTVCQNDLPIAFLGEVFPVGSASQTRDFHLTNQYGCDSVVTLHLTVNPIYENEDAITICASELPYRYEAMDTLFEVGTLSGNYRFGRATVNGCDSILTLHLTVLPVYEVHTAEVICQNELPYTWRDTLFAEGTQSGIYQFTRTSSMGCDSTVTLALIVHPSYAQEEALEVCENGFPLQWRDTTFLEGTTTGDFVFYRQTIHGCDSIVTLHVTVNPTFEENESLVICESDLPYTWRDITFPVGTASRTFTYNLQSMYGCDSIVTLALTVRPTFVQNVNLQICENDLPYYFAQADTTFDTGSQSGTYRFAYSNIYGCDSIITLHLSIYPYYEDGESLTICSSDLPYYYERENRTFQQGTTTGDYVFNHTTSHGCDSVWTLHLTVNQTYAQSQMLRLCENELPYTWNDTVFDVGTISGTFTFHRTTHLGCDSTITLTLFVYGQPSVNIIGTHEMTLGGTEMLVAQANNCSFVWNTGEESSVIYVTPDTAGTYTYSVTATHSVSGCSNTAYHTIVVEDTTGIPQYGTVDYHVLVYPNPATDVVTLRCDREDIAEVYLYNVLGRQVRRVRLDASQGEIELNGIAPGTYLLQVVMRNGDVIREKLIIH